jgi:hypothetical protein
VIEPLAAKLGISAAQLAVASALARGAKSIAMSTTRHDHILENIAAVSLVLPAPTLVGGEVALNSVLFLAHVSCLCILAMYLAYVFVLELAH